VALGADRAAACIRVGEESEVTRER
jgi:hypothetical protein